MTPNTPYHIMFVCTGNTCRSPMAEALMKKALKGTAFEQTCIVESAGLHATEGAPISVNSQLALEEMDCDCPAHKARMITYDMVLRTTHIFTMTRGHRQLLAEAVPEMKDKIFLLTEFCGQKDIDDPYGLNLEKYKDTAQEISLALQSIMKNI